MHEPISPIHIFRRSVMNNLVGGNESELELKGVKDQNIRLVVELILLKELKYRSMARYILRS